MKSYKKNFKLVLSVHNLKVVDSFNGFKKSLNNSRWKIKNFPKIKNILPLCISHSNFEAEKSLRFFLENILFFLQKIIQQSTSFLRKGMNKNIVFCLLRRCSVCRKLRT